MIIHEAGKTAHETDSELDFSEESQNQCHFQYNGFSTDYAILRNGESRRHSLASTQPQLLT